MTVVLFSYCSLSLSVPVNIKHSMQKNCNMSLTTEHCLEWFISSAGIPVQIGPCPSEGDQV